MASCGNACCAAELHSGSDASLLFDNITQYLQAGGADGLFNHTAGFGGLNVSTPEGPWTGTIQGTHTTFKERFVDVVNFAVLALPAGGSIVRIFSISDIAGALGDAGQNRRTVAFLSSTLDLGPMTVLFGCGASPSLPAKSEVGEQPSRALLLGGGPAAAGNRQVSEQSPRALLLGGGPVAARNQQVIEEYFNRVFFSGDFDLSRWLEEHIAPDGVFQFCPLTAEHLPSSRYPHCTNASGKEAYLKYVELDQGDFGNTRIANLSFAVSAEGTEVFSRYMVTGTLNGMAVPWFDQVMAWTFDGQGQIKQTTFWSDTLYWNHLYKQEAAGVQEQSARAERPSPPASLTTLLASAALIACGAFLAGMSVGSRGAGSRADTEPLLPA